MKKQKWKWLRRKANRGDRGFPIATVALYGPNDREATKIVVSIIPWEGTDPDPIRKWFSTSDVRGDERILEEVQKMLEKFGAKSVVMADRLIGCPHEEGIDYPDGEKCPRCPFWHGIDRWTGLPID